MPERYKKLYDLSHRLYAAESPVLIESGALLLEQPSNALLCQLCFRSVSAQPIQSIRAVVQPLDEEGLPLGKPVIHRYGDLNLRRDEEYGRETAIVLPGGRAASFQVRLSQVSLADGQIWTDEGLSWQGLPEQKSLEDFCGGEKAAEHFRKRFGSACRAAPMETEYLWFCACGGVNQAEEKKCHCCGCRRSALLGRGFGGDPEEQEENSFHFRESLSALSPRKRGLLLGAAGLVVLALLAFALLPRLKADPVTAAAGKAPVAASSPEVDSRQAAYEEAIAILEDGEFDRAEEIFRSLADYADSEEYLSCVLPYHRALALQEKADYAPLEDAPHLYEDAAAAFEALGDYEDSADRALQCRDELEELQLSLLQSDYDDAAALLEQGALAPARESFLALGEYEDSADQAREAVYRRASALYDYARTHDVRGVAAALTLEPGKENLIAIPRNRLLALGAVGVEDLAACFGADPVRFVPKGYEDGDFQPLEAAAAGLLQPLGEYRDSAELTAHLLEMEDESDTFFTLCASGELEAALDWLNGYEKSFDDRELWLGRIQRYLPYCGSWEMNTGDPTLPSQMAGGTEQRYSLRSKVLLLEDQAVLVLLLNEGDETGPELYAELDADRFMLHNGEVSYLAQVNPGGNLNLVKIAEYGGGVEYIPAA